MVGEAERAAYLRDYAAAASTAIDPDRFAFLHEVADEFARPQDVDQFTAGLDLLLAGLLLQADGRCGEVRGDSVGDNGRSHRRRAWRSSGVDVVRPPPAATDRRTP